MPDVDLITPPEASKKDTLHTLVRAGISAVPIVGGPVAEIFGAILIAPLSKRKDEWISSIAEGLQTLEETVSDFRVENLANNPVFVTTVMHATQVAIRNHDEEKLEALRNAVLNAALVSAPQDDIQLMFLSFVDILTPWHLRALKFFKNPVKWARMRNLDFPNLELGQPLTFIRYAFPELQGQEDFFDLLVKDLFSRGLLNSEDLGGDLAAEGLTMSRTTRLGNEFIDYIVTPRQMQ